MDMTLMEVIASMGLIDLMGSINLMDSIELMAFIDLMDFIDLITLDHCSMLVRIQNCRIRDSRRAAEGPRIRRSTSFIQT